MYKNIFQLNFHVFYVFVAERFGYQPGVVACTCSAATLRLNFRTA